MDLKNEVSPKPGSLSPAKAASLDFQAVFNIINTPLLILDADFNVVASNEARLKATGVSIAESLGRNIFEVFPDNPNDPNANGVAKLSASLHKVLETKAPDQMAIQKYDIPVPGSLTGEFEERYWRPINIPLLDANGKVCHIIHRVDDVTEEILGKQRETEMAAELRSAHELRELLTLMPIPIAIFRGPEHLYSFVNPAHDRMLGKKVMKKTFRQAHNEEETSLAYELVDRVYKTGEPVVTKEHHYVVTTDEGRKNEMYINEWFYPFHDLLGNIVGVLSCAQDVTEHVKARREAENANATKSAFLANMSHEIRTPLGAILGFADLMKDPSLSHQDRTQFLETISKNGKALTRIIDDILDLAKVESGKLHIEHVKLSLTMLMDEVIDLFRERAKAKGLYLKVKIAKNFPKVIYSDPTRIRQILINIIGNALKFTNTGGVTVEAKHKCADPDKINVSISVRDTGVGISASQRENLFQPFTQADNTTTRKFGGTGLGLSLSSRLAKALGGDVRIQDCRSNYESGCTFIITFTARSNADPHIEQVLAPQFLPAPPLAARVLEGLRILVADDSKDNQFLVTRLLTKNGARVDTANNGKEALTAALQSNYDLVLMDLQMPEMDGYEATRSLIEAGYKKPIVALTAHAMAEERAKTHLAGFSYHLTKPLEPADLISTIARLHSSRLH